MVAGSKRSSRSGCKKLHNKAFCDLHCSQDYLGLSCRGAMWARNEAYMWRGKKRTQSFWWVNRKERNRLGNRDVDGVV